MYVLGPTFVQIHVLTYFMCKSPLKRKVASQFVNVLAQFLTYYQHFCKKKKKKKKKWCGTQKWGGRGRETTLFFFMRPYRPVNGLEEFHQHVVLAYAENIYVIFRYIWRMQRIFMSFLDIFDLLNPNLNDASVYTWYMLSVLRLGEKNAFFGQKTCFKHVSKHLHFFLFRCVLIITF